MFIFDLKYIKPLDEVERVLPRHIRFLDEQYEKGKFLASGRKVPRIGGVILCVAETREEAKKIKEQDPFFQENIAAYEIIEFIPSKMSDAFQKVLVRE